MSSLPGPLDIMVIGKPIVLLDKLDVLPAVLRQILVLLDAADIALPARQLLIYRLCFLKQ